MASTLSIVQKRMAHLQSRETWNRSNERGILFWIGIDDNNEKLRVDKLRFMAEKKLDTNEIRDQELTYDQMIAIWKLIERYAMLGAFI